MKDRVCIIGSGNWGSAIATIIGPNVIQHSTLFEPIVHMWVFEEMVPLPSSLSSSLSSSNNKKKDEYKLTDVINTYHENVKYLPNIPLPHNIVATSSIETACCDATVLIFVLPHQFLNQRFLSQISHSKLNSTRCRAISLIKGIGTFVVHLSHSLCFLRFHRNLTLIDCLYLLKYFEISTNTDFDRNTHRPKLISHIIQDSIRITIPSFQCGVLMGANIANEVAKQQHICESTLACDFIPNSKNNDKHCVSLNERTRLLFHNEQCFRIQHTTDIVLTEMCGAIKNCVALGAGYIDGLNYGSNTKAALLRVGLYEMYHFALYFFPSTDSNHDKRNIQYSTMMESCGVADLITTCYSGRNRQCAETFAKERMTNTASGTKLTFDTCQQHWEDIEHRILNGQKIQGVSTVHEVYHILHAHGRTQYFPLLTTIYHITFGIEPVTSIVNGIRIINPTTMTSNDTNSKRTQRIPHQRSFL